MPYLIVTLAAIALVEAFWIVYLYDHIDQRKRFEERLKRDTADTPSVEPGKDGS